MLFFRRCVCLRPSPARLFSTTTPNLKAPLPPRPKVHDTDLIESFLKGSGPGGQKINKTSSAVQLKHLPTGIVIKCQETRSRTQNRKIARRILAERVQELEKGDEARTKIKEKEVGRKRKSADKKKRRKYRALAEGKEGKEDEGDELGEGEGEGEGEGMGEGVTGGVEEVGEAAKDDTSKPEVREDKQDKT